MGNSEPVELCSANRIFKVIGWDVHRHCERAVACFSLRKKGFELLREGRVEQAQGRLIARMEVLGLEMLLK